MMQTKKRTLSLTSAFAVLAATIFVTGVFATAQETVLYNFNDNSFAPWKPTSTLIFDGAGNLYGTTLEGGIDNGGTGFELSPQPGGGWNETVLHVFHNGDNEGYYPQGGLVTDGVGNFYGVAYYGGTGTNCGIFGGGTAFELSPTLTGGWKERVLHTFGSLPGCADGGSPWGGLTFDDSGNLYGTTVAGGAFGWGTIFKLSRTSGENWNEIILHSFDGNDGQAPNSTMVFDSAGNLYGTTELGGPYYGGTVFELADVPGGNWTLRVLHGFSTSSGGYQPQGALVFDTAGNVYGTTYLGGVGKNCSIGCGTVFELSPSARGWTKKTLHYFTNNGKDGYQPVSGLIFDAAGNLYGTTIYGGDSTLPNCSGLGCGTVFKLTLATGGTWAERIVHNFGAFKNDGEFPEAGMILDAAGNFYGTTSGAGSNLGGTVFEIAH
ncbi:MAG: hypothetical protein JWQ87_111 [Candidatus Sulfotelmatobacter sp.]|nr:hypothetical protein [Candidatus Sulfotelmatobacter sp.]